MRKNPDGTITADVLSTRSYEDPTEGFNYGRFSFQDFYGGEYMPALDWVRQIKTGEITYDPNDPGHVKNLSDYQKGIDNLGQPEGLPTPAEIVANEIGPLAGQLAEGVGTSLHKVLV